jgi:acetamidase/formamidase
VATYIIEPTAENLHGAFSPDLAPILTIEPGDTVRYRTLDAGWNMSRPTTQDWDQWDRFPQRDPKRDRGHALNGPIYIRGARPGMALVVHIEVIEPGAWGWNSATDWSIKDESTGQSPTACFFWDIDRAAGTARNQLGQEVPLRPFMGLLGMPPDEAGWHSTVSPRYCGGNMDCKELVAGSTLYLPISVEGGLFSVGDGHACQSDGEISGTGIECPMERVDIRFELVEEAGLQTPRANTPAGWVTLGFDPDLNLAYDSALEGMIDLMCRLYGISRLNAISLASLIVEMRITQRVNGTNGVHALLPHDAYQTDGRH